MIKLVKQTLFCIKLCYLLLFLRKVTYFFIYGTKLVGLFSFHFFTHIMFYSLLDTHTNQKNNKRTQHLWLLLFEIPYFQNSHVAEIQGCKTRWIEQKKIIRRNNVALIILCCHNTICAAPDQSNFDMTNKPLRGNGGSINCSTVWPNTKDILSSNAHHTQLLLLNQQ